MSNFTTAELARRNEHEVQRQKCRDGYQQFLVNCRPHAFVTLAINRGPKHLEPLKEKLKNWGFLVDRTLNNNPRRLARLPSERRLNGWFVGEKQKTNGHLHGLIRFPEQFSLNEWRFLQMQTILNEQWRQVVPSGNVILQPIYDAKGVADYSLKEAYYGDDFFGSLVELADFWPASKPQQRA